MAEAEFVGLAGTAATCSGPGVEFVRGREKDHLRSLPSSRLRTRIIDRELDSAVLSLDARRRRVIQLLSEDMVVVGDGGVRDVSGAMWVIDVEDDTGGLAGTL